MWPIRHLILRVVRSKHDAAHHKQQGIFFRPSLCSRSSPHLCFILAIDDASVKDRRLDFEIAKRHRVHFKRIARQDDDIGKLAGGKAAQTAPKPSTYAEPSVCACSVSPSVRAFSRKYPSARVPVKLATRHRSIHGIK